MAERPHDGHRERLKARFEKEGLMGFEPHEVLELLLFYAMPRRDTNPIAHELLKRFGSLDKVLDADVEELMEVGGVGRHAASLISMMPRLFQYYARCRFSETPKMEDCESMGRYFCAQIGLMENEVFAAAAFDAANRWIAFEIISEGFVSQTEIRLRALVEFAVRKKASMIVVAHNHVNGPLCPSQADRDATRLICRSLGQIGVKVADHIIVSGDGYFSFAMNDIMPI